MKNLKLITGAALATLMLASGPALAKGPHFPMGGERMKFEDLDADNNGEVTKEEVQAVIKSRFDAGDTDGDGKLSAAELAAEGHKQVDARVQAMIKNMDKDGDGMLAADELPSPDRAGRMFGIIDADGNGTISAAEFAEIRERMKEHGGMRKNKN